MHRYLFVAIILFIAKSSFSQNSFVFSCTKDTTLTCANSCIDLKTIVPNIKNFTGSYKVVKTSGSGGCFVPPTKADLLGPSANLTSDDTYTGLLTLPFTFPFYGAAYSQAVISTNGVICFDNTKANASAHYGILNGGGFLSASSGTPADLPNSLYHRAVIMGLYADIDPTVTTSPTQQIKYESIGVAPHRKWVVSFYKVPCFGTSCTNLIKNTYQMVLYEGIGVIDVFVYSKEICTSWNQGRGMVGIQDYNRTNGLMAPGRAASSTVWGGATMNESWRFIPAGGNPLLKRVELVGPTGNVVALGDTLDLGNGTYQVTFRNVCTNSSTNYIVKSVYGQWNNPAVEEIGTDTLRVFNSSAATPIAETITPAPCGVSTTGTITITSPVGVNIQYTVSDGTTTTIQYSPTITGAPGIYTIIAKDTVSGCSSTKSITIGTQSTLSATAISDSAACAGSASGSITITATNGGGTYTYSMDGGPFLASNIFGSLASGIHQIDVKDNLGCLFSFTATIFNRSGFTASSAPTRTSCLGASNGGLVFAPIGGTSPFSYSLNGGTPQLSGSFTGLVSGNYTALITDNNGCTFSKLDSVKNGAGFTTTTTTSPAACSGSSTGSISILVPTSGTSPYLYKLDTSASSVFQNSNAFSNLISGTYNLVVKDNNGCLFNLTASINNSPGVQGAASAVNAACLSSATGKIIVKANLGTAPFYYSKDSGLSYQALDTFYNLLPGNYNIAIKDFNGCKYYFTQTVGANVGTTATTATINSACAFASTGKIIVTPVLGQSPFRFSLDNINFQANDTFSNLASGTYPVYVKDNFNCPFLISAIVNNDIGVQATTSSINAACAGSSTGMLLVNASAGTAPFVYLIDTSASNQFQTSSVFMNLAAGNYNLIVKDSNNCSYNLTGVVTNNIGVTADTIIDKASCAIVPNGKITIIPQAGVSPFTYSINGINFQPSNEFGQLFSGNFIVTIKDNASCLKVMNIVVGNAARVVVDSVRIISPSCNGRNNGVISVYPRLGVPPYTYSINSSPWQVSNVFNNRAASTSDTIRIRDNSGCVKDTIVVVTEPSLLSVSTTSKYSSCTGNPDGSITVVAAGGTAPYLYKLGSSAGAGYQGNSTFALVAGTYTFSVKDANGCITSKVDSVLLNDTMRLELGPDTTLCIGKTITFFPKTNNETTIFKWQPSDYLNDSLFKNPTASPADTIKYYLEAKWGICKRKDSVVVNVLLKPIAYAGRDTAVCLKTPAFLKGNAGKVSGSVSYLWAPSRFLDRTDTTIAICRPDTTGTYRYFLTVKDNYGCGFVTTDSVKIVMQPPVPAFAGNDTNAVFEGPHQLWATGGVSYSWSPIGPLDNPNIAKPLATINQDTYFIVTVTDFAGCVGSDIVLLRAYVGPTYHCPNAFSPNNDGNNDRFRPLPVGIRSTEYFRVYNRVGQLMFETNVWEGQFLRGWDGSFRGKPQEVGTYVWVIKGTDEKGNAVLKKGSVVLVR